MVLVFLHKLIIHLINNCLSLWNSEFHHYVQTGPSLNSILYLFNAVHIFLCDK